MILNSLIIDNIRSYDHEEVVFPRGISLFEGDIGSGKSTILMAIEFALFGLGSQKAESVNQELSEKTAEIDAANKVVIIKIQGELMSGKTADVDVSLVRDNLNDKDALVVNVSKNQLTSKEYAITEAKGSNKEEIETNVFSENIGQLKFDYPELLDESGIKLATKLLQELGQPKLENEKNNEYVPRIRDSALVLLGLDDDS